MKQSVLDNMERIVEQMIETGWKEKSRMLTAISGEKKTLLEALSQAFIDLAVESFNVAEAKYIGYVKLVESRDKTDMLDSIRNFRRKKRSENGAEIRTKNAREFQNTPPLFVGFFTERAYTINW